MPRRRTNTPADDFDTSSDSDGLELVAVAPPVAENAVSVVPTDELPKDLEGAIRLLQATETLGVVTRDEQRHKAAKLRLVRAHVFRLQQGLPVVDFTSEHQAEERIGHAVRVARIAARL